MSKKTYGPLLLMAIDKNNVDKVHEILSKQIHNKTKVKELCLSDIRRLPSDIVDCPLLLAASSEDPAVLICLVEKHDVNINHTFKTGTGRKLKVRTALLTAVRKSLYETVEAILSCNADIDLQDHKGRTPLHHSIKKADFRMSKILLIRGAQVNLPDKANNTALHTATIFGHAAFVELLLSYNGDPYKRGQHGAIAFHMAVSEGHLDLVNIYCKHGANVDLKVPCYGEREVNSLHIAAERGHVSIATVLISKYKADITAEDGDGETPLHCTVLEPYDSLSMRTKDDFTVLAALLIKCGADVNARNGRGETVMHLAARHEFNKIIDILVNNSGDPTIEDDNGHKPLDLVCDDEIVIRQTLKSAMQKREKLINNLLEGHAKGVVPSTNRLASAGSVSSVASTVKSVNLRNEPIYEEEYLTPSIRELQEEEAYQTIEDAAISEANRSLENRKDGDKSLSMENSDNSDQYTAIGNHNKNRALPATPDVKPSQPVNRNLLGGQTDTDYAPWSEHGSDTYYGIPSKGALSSFTPLPASIPRVSNHTSMNHSTGSDDTYFDDASFDTLDPYTDGDYDEEDDDEDDYDDGKHHNVSVKSEIKIKRAKSPPPIPSLTAKPKPPPRKPTTIVMPPKLPELKKQEPPLNNNEAKMNSKQRAASPANDLSFEANDISIRRGDPSKGEAATVITVHKAISISDQKNVKKPKENKKDKRLSTGSVEEVKTFGDKLAAFQRGSPVYSSHRPSKQPPAPPSTNSIQKTIEEAKKTTDQHSKSDVQELKPITLKPVKVPQVKKPIQPVIKPTIEPPKFKKQEVQPTPRKMDTEPIAPVPAKRPEEKKMTFLPAPVKDSHPVMTSSPQPKPRERSFEQLNDISADEDEEEEDIQNTGHYVMEQFERSYNPEDFTVNIHKTFPTNNEVEKKAKDASILPSTQKSIVKDAPANKQNRIQPAKTAPLQTIPNQSTPTQATPLQFTPTQTTPLQFTPTQATPLQSTPTQATPLQSTPTQATPLQSMPTQAGYDEYGGYYDDEGGYYDQYGGYYDAIGNYYKSYTDSYPSQMADGSIPANGGQQDQQFNNRQQPQQQRPYQQQQQQQQQMPYQQQQQQQQQIPYQQQPQQQQMPYQQQQQQQKPRHVTLNEDHMIPLSCLPPTDSSPRRVIFDAGSSTQMPSISLAGGNALGIFIQRVRPGSDAQMNGITEADEIIAIGNVEMKNKTREEASIFFGRQNGRTELTLRHRPDVYVSVSRSGDCGDSLLVRANYNYSGDQHQHRITENDVFAINSTLPRGHEGQSWRGACVDGLSSRDDGYIPNAACAEKILMASRSLSMTKRQRGSKDNNGDGFLRRSFRRTKSLDRLGNHRERSGSASSLNPDTTLEDMDSTQDMSLDLSIDREVIRPAYDRVTRQAIAFPRPMVLVGPFAEAVRSRLGADPRGIYEQYVESKPHKSRRDRSVAPPIFDVTKIRKAMRRGKHSLMVGTPNVIRAMTARSLHPIVVFLSPGSRSILKTVRSTLAPEVKRKINSIADEAYAFTHQYSHLFTGTVQYTANDSWFPLLAETLERCQSLPVWQTIDENFDPDDRSEEVEDDGICDSDRMGMKLNRSTDDIPDSVDFASNKPPSGKKISGSMGGALGGSMGGAMSGSMGGALGGSMGGAMGNLTGTPSTGGLSKSGSIGSHLNSSKPAPNVSRSFTTDAISSNQMPRNNIINKSANENVQRSRSTNQNNLNSKQPVQRSPLQNNRTQSASNTHTKRYQPSSNISDNVFANEKTPSGSNHKQAQPHPQHQQQNKPRTVQPIKKSPQNSNSVKPIERQTGRRGSRPTGPRTRMNHETPL